MTSMYVLRIHRQDDHWLAWSLVPVRHKPAVVEVGGVAFDDMQAAREATEVLNYRCHAKQSRATRTVFVPEVGWVYVPTAYEIGLILRQKLREIAP